MPTFNLSRNGSPVSVVGNSVQTATVVHRPINTNEDGVGFWNIFAFNTSQQPVSLYVQIGIPHCVLTINIPPAGL